VAWLVREEKIMPEEMVVVTFTNKAANEMKQRLFKLIGGDRTSRLVLGGCDPE
jgi:DNA helicase-2/ATP-dependent DNA helicase PcrA